MLNIFHQTQEALFFDGYELREAISTIRRELELLSDEPLAHARTCLRLLLAHQAQLEGMEVAAADFLVLVRQIARYFGLIRVPSAWWQTIASQYERFGLEVRANDDRAVDVIATEWIPAWLPNVYEIDTLVTDVTHRASQNDVNCGHER